MPDILTTSEAAALLKLGRSSLEKWRCTGVGPKFVRLGRKRIVYLKSELEAWVASQPHLASTSEAG